MRKLFYQFGLLVVAGLFLVTCGVRVEVVPRDHVAIREAREARLAQEAEARAAQAELEAALALAAVTDEGVVISGVRWATRNVDAPGTFALTPESSGLFFQWNRQQGWPATGDVTNWNTEHEGRRNWHRTTDPCPAGWRIPTREEFQSLLDSGSEWVTRHDVSGWLLGASHGQVFLPSVGFRSTPDGRHHTTAQGHGGYWINESSIGVNRSNSIRFNSTRIEVSNSGSNEGLNVRCVAIDEQPATRTRN